MKEDFYCMPDGVEDIQEQDTGGSGTNENGEV